MPKKHEPPAYQVIAFFLAVTLATAATTLLVLSIVIGLTL